MCIFLKTCITYEFYCFSTFTKTEHVEIRVYFFTKYNSLRTIRQK